MGKTIKDRIIEEIEHLPGYSLQEVLDFVAYLKAKERPRPERATEEDPILKVAGCLSGEPITPAEIEEDLYGEGSS